MCLLHIQLNLFLNKPFKKQSNVNYYFMMTKQNEIKKKRDLFSEEYKSFLSLCKTERECIKFFSERLENCGFKKLEELIRCKVSLKPGDKVYATNMNKAIVAFKIGRRPLQEGLNIIAAHIDSPRLDLKSKPVYGDGGFCLLDTHYYGGIKKYQWMVTPLALHGVVCKKNGENIDLEIGESDKDPIFIVTDLLPHLDKMKEKEINAELLNLIIATDCEEKNAEEKGNSLLQKYGCGVKDLISSEIEVVPAGKARDFGLDKSMIAGYGHDDRCCAYAGLSALIDTDLLDQTAAVVLVDKEEIGSTGATGMKSRFFENIVAEVMNLSGQYNELSLKRALNKSNALSCDVTAAYDPNWPEPSNKNTEAYISKGLAFCKFTGDGGKNESNDANPEYIARIRKILDEENICYQFTEMGKVDKGGGGTIAKFLSEYGMNVIDAGLAVLSMHAPWEIISKFDLYESFRCCKTFLEKI